MKPFVTIWTSVTIWVYLLPLMITRFPDAPTAPIVPQVAAAPAGPPPPPDPNLAKLQAFFTTVRTDIVSLALSIAGVCFALSAVLYSTAGHNERRLEAAKVALYAALIGLVLALLSDPIVALIQSATGQTGQ